MRVLVTTEIHQLLLSPDFRFSDTTVVVFFSGRNYPVEGDEDWQWVDGSLGGLTTILAPLLPPTCHASQGLQNFGSYPNRDSFVYDLFSNEQLNILYKQVDKLVELMPGQTSVDQTVCMGGSQDQDNAFYDKCWCKLQLDTSSLDSGASDEAFCAAFTAQLNHSHSPHHDITAFPSRRAIDINCVVCSQRVSSWCCKSSSSNSHLLHVTLAWSPLLTVNYDKTSLRSMPLNMCIGAVRS